MKKYCCDDKTHTSCKRDWTKLEIDCMKRTKIPKPHRGMHKCGESCRESLIKNLKPNVIKQAAVNFAEDEEDLIIRLYALLGNRWPLIAGRLPGRTENEVKNYWDSHIKRKLIKMGIDPNSHALKQTLHTTFTANKNIHVLPEHHPVMNKSPSTSGKQYPLPVDPDSGFKSSLQLKMLSSRGLNLDLNIVFPPPPPSASSTSSSSSSSSTTTVEKPKMNHDGANFQDNLYDF